MRSCGRRSRSVLDEPAPLDPRRDRRRDRRPDRRAPKRRERRLDRHPHASPGDLFFAIKGDVHDGHGFVRDALAKGAAAAVVAEDRAAEFAGAGPLLVAPDVLDAMRRLGIAARRRSNATVVAVTGSVGKTGTKERCGSPSSG
jgi:hypothetical protein